jgi:hypothetical protein
MKNKRLFCTILVGLTYAGDSIGLESQKGYCRVFVDKGISRQVRILRPRHIASFRRFFLSCRLT